VRPWNEVMSRQRLNVADGDQCPSQVGCHQLSMQVSNFDKVPASALKLSSIRITCYSYGAVFSFSFLSNLNDY